MTSIPAGPKTTVNLDGDTDLTMSRIFEAPRELLFKAWTEPERLMAWWGPREWPLAVCNVDLRTGGRWHYCMRGPNGEQAWGLGEYQAIEPPQRLVILDSFSNEKGEAIPPAQVMTVEFEDLGGRTLLKARSTFDSEKHREQVVAMGMVEGMTESLDRLDEHLAA